MFVKHGVISFCVIFAFCKCQPISDQFQASRRHFEGMSSSEEMYYHHPQQEYYNQPPAPYMNIDHSMGPPLYPAMMAHPRPDVAPHDPYSSESLFPQVPHFQPDVRYGTFENPFKKMIDPMRKEMSDSIKGMSDTMGNQTEEMGKQAEQVGKQFTDAGQQMTESMQKPAEEVGKQMQDAMEDANDQFEEHVDSMRQGAEEARTAIPFAPTSSSNSNDAKKKLEDAASKKGGKEEKDLSDVKKKMVEDENPMKKMQDSGNKLKKTFPVPGSLVGSIKDETTEVHEDEGDFPRAEAMEWGPSHFVDLRYHHPRSRRVFDYYDDGDY